MPIEFAKSLIGRFHGMIFKIIHSHSNDDKAKRQNQKLVDWWDSGIEGGRRRGRKGGGWRFDPSIFCMHNSSSVERFFAYIAYCMQFTDEMTFFYIHVDIQRNPLLIIAR